MQRSRTMANSVFLLAMAILFSSVSGSAAQQARRTIIRIEVKPPETAVIKSLVEEGDSLRIEDHSHDRTLTFKPDVASVPAKIQVFRIQKDPAGKEVEVLLEEARIDAIGQDSPPTRVLENYTVRILQVIKP